MANADAAFGLRPVRYLSGQPYNAAAGVTALAWDTSTALAVGDPVVFSGTASSGIPEVKRAAAAGPIDGVIQGYLSDVAQAKGVVLRDNNRTIPATSSNAGAAYVLLAIADPDLLFEVQEDSVGETVQNSEVGLHANLTQSAPSTANGQSTVELDSNTAAADTTAGLAVKIVALKEAPDNSTGTNAKWYVTVVKSTFHTAGPSR